jgi:dTDP-4-amino-4,6-dideoxygalactose transaminase
VRTRPFAPWPKPSAAEIDAVTSVLRSGRLNYWTGEQVRRFEEDFAAFTGCRHAIAVSNGTVALELALYALGMGPSDEVIVPCRTFVASASCVVIRGATPVFADIDPVSQTITAETISRVLSPRTRAIIAVHLAGWPCDMDPIMALARQHGIKVIEDCAQAHGAIYKDRPVGSLGDIAAFSFCQDKIMTTGGEGGMITTNDDHLCRAAWSFKDHGKNYAARSQQPSPVFRWLHDSIGTNWRLTEMQAAIGRVLVSRLPEDVVRRRRNAAILTNEFASVPALRTTVPSHQFGHAYYKYYAFVRPEMLQDGWDRDLIAEAVRAEGIPCASGSCSEIYLEEAFPESMRPTERLPVGKALGETSLMFLVHPTLSADDMFDTALAVQKVMRAASSITNQQAA